MISSHLDGTPYSSVQRPPVIKQPSIVVSLYRNIRGVSGSFTGLPLHPPLTAAVPGIFHILAGMEQRASRKSPIYIANMRCVAAEIGNLEQPVILMNS